MIFLKWCLVQGRHIEARSQDMSIWANTEGSWQTENRETVFLRRGGGAAGFRLSLAQGGGQLPQGEAPQGMAVGGVLAVAPACWPQSLRAGCGRRVPEWGDTPGQHRPCGLVAERGFTLERLDMWGGREPGARNPPSALLLFPLFTSLQNRGFQSQSSFQKVCSEVGGGECL